MIRERNERKWIALALIAIGICYRVLPHPMNFTPLTAIALFSGSVLTPGVALTVPVIAMIASDLWIGPHDLYWLTWGAFVAVTFIGSWVGRSYGWKRLILGSFAGSLFFFIATNLGVFFFEALYPKTPAGFTECFWMAIPFFRNSVLGDLFFTGVLFGIYGLTGSLTKKESALRS